MNLITFGLGGRALVTFGLGNAIFLGGGGRRRRKAFGVGVLEVKELTVSDTIEEKKVTDSIKEKRVSDE